MSTWSAAGLAGFPQIHTQAILFRSAQTFVGAAKTR
jgi:hypothetical protein